MKRLTAKRSKLHFAEDLTVTFFIGVIILSPGFFFPIYWRLFSTFFVFFALAGTLRYYLSVFTSIKRIEEPPEIGTEELPTLSIIVPVLNEEKVLERNIDSLLALDYPEEKVDLVYVYCEETDDRSLDIIKGFPRIKVVPQPKATGKQIGLNLGVRRSRGEIVAFVDADTSLAPDFARRAAAWLMKGDMAAVKGRVRSVNKRESFFGGMVSAERDIRERIEYYSKYRIDGFAVFTGGHLVIRRDVLDDLGPFDPDMMTEDMDYACKVQMDGMILGNDPMMKAYEELPVKLSSWSDQRYRWYRGWLEASWAHFGRALVGTKCRRFRRFDTILLMLLTLLAPLVLFYYPLVILKATGAFEGVFYIPEGVVTLAAVIQMFAPLAVTLNWILDKKEGETLRFFEWPAIILMLPYLLLYSLVSWKALIDTFVFRREKAYRKYPRSGWRDSERAKRRKAKPAPSE